MNFSRGKEDSNAQAFAYETFGKHCTEGCAELSCYFVTTMIPCRPCFPKLCSNGQTVYLVAVGPLSLNQIHDLEPFLEGVRIVTTVLGIGWGLVGRPFSS